MPRLERFYFCALLLCLQKLKTEGKLAHWEYARIAEMWKARSITLPCQVFTGFLSKNCSRDQFFFFWVALDLIQLANVVFVHYVQDLLGEALKHFWTWKQIIGSSAKVITPRISSVKCDSCCTGSYLKLCRVTLRPFFSCAHELYIAGLRVQLVWLACPASWFLWAFSSHDAQKKPADGCRGVTKGMAHSAVSEQRFQTGVGNWKQSS